MIHAVYVLPEGQKPADGDTLATTLGWSDWSNWVLARAEHYPETAQTLAGFGEVDGEDEMAECEHELAEMLHDPECDPDIASVTAAVLAAVRALPDEAVGLRASTGESGEDEDEEEEGDAVRSPVPG